MRVRVCLVQAQVGAGETSLAVSPFRAITPPEERRAATVSGGFCSDPGAVAGPRQAQRYRENFMIRLSEVRDGLVRIPLAYTNAPGTIFEQGNQKFKISERDL